MQLPIVFCVDHHALPGLQTTVFTLASRCSDDDVLTIYLVENGLSDRDIAEVRRTLNLTLSPNRYALVTISADTNAFSEMRWQGGHTTYLRLKLPEIIPERRFLYLDADLLVFCRIAEIFAQELGEHPLGACSWGTAGDSNDRMFYESRNWPLDVPYFNAGVLLFDTPRWKALGLSERIKSICSDIGRVCPTMDQTIVNVALMGQFQRLPRRFNTPVTASRRTLKDSEVSDRVVHLVAHPKPWERLGWLNGQYRHYRRACQEMRARGIQPMHDSTSVGRLLRWSRAYVKCAVARLKSGLSQ